jgi:hypothetical protein
MTVQPDTLAAGHPEALCTPVTLMSIVRVSP